MISEREWIVRLGNLLQNEKEIAKQLQNICNRLSSKLTKEEGDLLTSASKALDQSNPLFLQTYTGLEQQIINIRPLERGFKLRLDHLEKDITSIRVQSAADLERINGNIKKIHDAIITREKRSNDLQTPAISGAYPKNQNPPVFDSPIQEFQEYISKNGGFTGGWDSESHAAFIRAYNRHEGEDLSEYLPNIPSESVEAHTTWYKNFLTLKQRMKLALQQQREENRKKEDSAPSSPKVDPEFVKKRIQERLELKQKQQQDAALLEQQQKEADEREKKERYEKVKKELLSRQKKPFVPKPIIDKTETTDKSKSQVYNKEDWERIKKREKEVLEKKAAAVQKKQDAWYAHQELERKLAEKNAQKYKNIKRDPERLMKPTAAMLAKKKTDENESKGPVNSVFEIPHRAVPQWLL